MAETFNLIIVREKPARVQPNTILDADFVSLTDVVHAYNAMIEPRPIIQHWIRRKDTLEFLAEWETRNNPNFDRSKVEAIIPSTCGRFSDNAPYITANVTMSVQQWVNLTNAIGIVSIPGRNGGTYAHEYIALAFAESLSASLRLDIISSLIEYKRQQDIRYNIMWDIQRDACRKECTMFNGMVRDYVAPYVPNTYYAHATNADLHNFLVFGIPAVVWRMQHPEEAAKGQNMRDFATAQQLEELRFVQALDSILVARGYTLEQRANILYIKLSNMRGIQNPQSIIVPDYDHDQQFLIEVKRMYMLLPDQGDA